MAIAGLEAFHFKQQTMMKMKTRILTLILAFTLGLTAFTADINFVEKFALGERKAALKLLILGTTNYYYYHALDAHSASLPNP